MIVFNCPKCGKEFKAKDQHAGRKFACSKCAHEMYVPKLQELQKPLANSTADSEPASVTPTPMESLETFSLPPEEPAEVLSAPMDTSVDSEPASVTPTPMKFAEATAPQDDSDVLPAFAPTPNYGAKVLSVLKGVQSSIDGCAKTPRQGAEAPDVNHGLRRANQETASADGYKIPILTQVYMICAKIALGAAVASPVVGLVVAAQIDEPSPFFAGLLGGIVCLISAGTSYGVAQVVDFLGRTAHYTQRIYGLIKVAASPENTVQQNENEPMQSLEKVS